MIALSRRLWCWGGPAALMPFSTMATVLVVLAVVGKVWAQLAIEGLCVLVLLELPLRLRARERLLLRRLRKHDSKHPGTSIHVSRLPWYLTKTAHRMGDERRIYKQYGQWFGLR